MDAYFWLTNSGGLIRVVLLVKIDESDWSIVIEKGEDVPRVRGVRQSTPMYNPGIVKTIKLTQSGCVQASLPLLFIKIFDNIPARAVATDVLEFSMQDLNQFYEEIFA